MKKKIILFLILLVSIAASFSFREEAGQAPYTDLYAQRLAALSSGTRGILELVRRSDLALPAERERILTAIAGQRLLMKGMDIWLRYLEPVAYKKINGPLPVEWETEAFEKFEKPYKREGAGFTLAALYLEQENPSRDSLLSLTAQALTALDVYDDDSITASLRDYHHFFLCNRLYLLNLAAIYTTGFECPDPDRIVPELRYMMRSVKEVYAAYDKGFPATPLSSEYHELYNRALQFAEAQPADFTQFDHFSFLRDYVNQLYLLNQQLISRYKVRSRSMIDFSLNKKEITIFNKALYASQNVKGIFHRVTDSAALAEIDRLGKLLFYDPVLSGNNQRSCASCHKPDQYFADTLAARPVEFNHNGLLPRNTPSLINASFNHLVMQDGRHTDLQRQTRAVITNPAEMGASEADVLKKVLSCDEYREGFTRLLAYTPTEKEISFEHIASALTMYYSRFSNYYAPFDEAMNRKSAVAASVREGFNLFMSKAQCATCHFVPQFNGVKPPYAGSEFEVLGVPSDKQYSALSPDKGRYEVNPATETLNAFRTGTLRNSRYTAPYMHNGVFATLEEVIDFYDTGGGAGHGLNVVNQTLSSDSLKLTAREKRQLISFINALNENIRFEAAPEKLPFSAFRELNSRKVGGEY